MSQDSDRFEQLTFEQRLQMLRATKLQQTQEKQQVLGAMDYDDWALILPPPERRKLIKTISSSGIPINDCLLDGFELQSNHLSGGFFGPRAVGANFRALLEAHPVYIDPVSSLAGGYMASFNSYRKPQWNPDFDYSHLAPEIERITGIKGELKSFAMQAVTHGEDALGEAFYRPFQDIIDRSGVPVRLQHCGPRFGLYFGVTDPVRNYRQAAQQDERMLLTFVAGCIRRGVYFHVSAHHGFSAAHTAQDMHRALEGIEGAMADVRRQHVG